MNRISDLHITYRPKGRAADREIITCSDDVVRVARKIYQDGEIGYREQIKVLCLNNRNAVLGSFVVSVGGISECPADIRTLFQSALLTNASKVILVHNHPAGDPSPSNHDMTFTRRVKDAGDLLNIPLVDHVILSENSSYSMVDTGVLK